MSLRHALKLVNSSKLKLLPSSSSQISIIRLSSYDSKFLRQFDRKHLHVIRTFKTGNTNGRSSSHQQTDNNLYLIVQKLYFKIRGTLGLFIFACICTVVAINLEIAKKFNPAVLQALETEPIEFDEFLTHILPTGEVLSVTYFPTNKLAIALLHSGALINGKPYSSDAIAIKFNPVSLSQAFDEIRNAEEKLGLPLRERIPINDVYVPFSRIIISMIKFAFFGYLGSGLFKWVRRQVVSKRT